jgi:sulfite exporter TauE/SafE
MIIAAFLMGLIGSLHCAVMCGPLALAVPVVAQTRASLIASRLFYNLGRITVYGILGLLFGAIGKSIVLSGLQQWLSIIAGLVMLVFLILEFKGMKMSLWKSSVWIKSIFRNFLKHRSYLAVFILGLANGLLTCGLVYLAGTASIAAGAPFKAAGYMIFFGLGTFPVMLGITLFGTRFVPLVQRMNFKPAIPIFVSLVALSLILRGMSLGIPYFSPRISNTTFTCPACLR